MPTWFGYRIYVNECDTRKLLEQLTIQAGVEGFVSGLLGIFDFGKVSGGVSAIASWASTDAALIPLIDRGNGIILSVLGVPFPLLPPIWIDPQ